MYLKAALKDAGGFLPPRVKMTGWSAYSHWLRTSPYRLRHAFRRHLVLPSKKKVDAILHDLWERGIIVRGDFTHTQTEFYRLKN
jgi:hypothetical protein